MKATVCSLVPYEVKDTKPGIIPYEYIVPPSNGIIPSLLVINDASCPLYRGSEMPSFPMIIAGEQIAKSVVDDYCKAQFEYAPDSYPALFWVPGEFKLGKEILEKFPAEIVKAKKMQANWHEKLFRRAEDTWARNHQFKEISDIQRFAARSLGRTSVEWYVSPDPVIMVKCPACMTLIEADAIVCRNCKHVLNIEKAKNLAFAT